MLEEKSDDSILLILIVRIMDALGNFGNELYVWMNKIPFNFFEMLRVVFLYNYFQHPPFSSLDMCVSSPNLGQTGSLEYEEWSNHRQAWKLESAAILEPPMNFIVSSHSRGKKRQEVLS
jgi:proteasome activator subunit 4